MTQSRQQRREALVRACEYDRLQVRLACARAALERPRPQERVASIAGSIFRVVSLGDVVKIAAHFLSKK